MLYVIVQPHLLEQRKDALFAIRRRGAALQEQREFDVLKDGQDIDEIEALKNEPQVMQA